ncbi:MAG: hypothetical protein HOM15_02065 [Gammaproteobacteria bacterium]|nr:hypothetical protein [Gammaproteobacteria bacterium]
MFKFFIYFIGIQLTWFSIEQSVDVYTYIITPFTEMMMHVSDWANQGIVDFNQSR